MTKGTIIDSIYCKTIKKYKLKQGNLLIETYKNKHKTKGYY